MNAAARTPFGCTDDEMHNFLKRALTNMIERTDIELQKGQRGRLYAWYWGYYGRAAADLYTTTGDRRFKTLIEETIDALLNERDDQLGSIDAERGFAFPGWGTKYKTGECSNEITTAGLICMPMLEYARTEGLSWLADAACETLTSFKGERLEATNGRYYFEHQTQHVVEALNHSALYGAALTQAAQLVEDDWLIDTARGLYQYHVSFTERRGAGLTWPYAPSPGEDKSEMASEAIWKAAATIELPIALSENGDESARQFLQDIGESLAQHPQLIRGEFPRFLGHDRIVPLDSTRINGGLTSFIGSFLQLGSLALNERLFDLMRKSPDYFPNGWKGGSRAMPMAWAHLRRHGGL